MRRIISLLAILISMASIFALSVNSSMNASANASMNGSMISLTDDTTIRLVEEDIPKGLAAFFLRVKAIFQRNAEAQADVHLRLALQALNKAERAAERGDRKAAERALKAYEREIKRVKELFKHAQPSSQVLERIALYKTYEERVKALLEVKGIDEDEESLEDILHETLKEEDVERFVQEAIRKRVKAVYGENISIHVEIRNEERFLIKVKARVKTAELANISIPQTVYEHISMAEENILTAKRLANLSNYTGARAALREVHQHSLTALRILTNLTRNMTRNATRERVILKLEDGLVIIKNGTVRILPLPKPVSIDTRMRIIEAHDVETYHAWKHEREEREEKRERVKEEVREHMREAVRERMRIQPFPEDEEMHGEAEGSATGSMEWEGDEEEGEMHIQANISVQHKTFFP